MASTEQVTAGTSLNDLAARVIRDYRLALYGIHGPAHWLRVRANGLTLAGVTPGADSRVVELFALFHDGWRHDEDRDLGHGERAAAQVRIFAAEGALPLTSEQVATLAQACAGHEHAQISRDPTIGCCWDADRLDLSRLRRRPIPRLMSTAAARGAEVQAAAWKRGLADVLDHRGLLAWGLEGMRARFR